MNKKVIIIGGGTINPDPLQAGRASYCIPEFGDTTRRLIGLARDYFTKMDVHGHLTRLAGGGEFYQGVTPSGYLQSDTDVETLVDQCIADPSVKVMFMPVTMVQRGRELQVIGKIRKERKDIFLVSWHHARCKDAEYTLYMEGLYECKELSCNLVVVESHTLNMVVSPEEARYHVSADIYETLKGVVEMAYQRSHLTFTRSTVVAGEAVPWTSDLVPANLRAVVDHCIQKNAYKPFNGATAGHFAVKVNDNTFLTSIRKTNFNHLAEKGLVKVTTDGPDNVIAYGFKPSVGGQSQRIVFTDHPDTDCIVHFHCPKKEGSAVPTVSQREFECGSHECGKNTSTGLQKFGNLWAVFLDQHGPNIVFNRNTDPQEVINFIEDNFDLSQKTGGYEG
jgi:hypothetical protein